jgi:hypothetical protein
MSLSDGELHGVAGAGVSLLCGGMLVWLVVGNIHGCGDDAAADNTDPLDKLESIEASLAVRKTPQKQAQKQFKTPEPEKKVEGVSKDPDKKDDKKKPDDKKTSDKPKDFKIPDRRPTDDNAPTTDKPPPEAGDFNDSARGFADVTSGDPFFRELAADFHENWEFPGILATQSSAAGCLHILADGTIKKTQVKPKSGDAALDDSVERALKKVEKLRNEKPVPVPSHLLQQATTRWICFKTTKQDRQQ